MVRRFAGWAVLLWAAQAFAQDGVAPGPKWDPNRDTAFIELYIRRELTLEFDRVDPRRGIEGTVRNAGGKTLTRVRVLLSFADDGGRPSGEYEFSALPWSGPVRPGEPQERPLGPGGSRHFLVYPSSVAAGWSDRWQAAITSITFAPEPS